MEACSLVTAADLEAALGEPFEEGTTAPANMPNICNFFSTATKDRNVSMVLYAPGGAAMLPMMMPQPTDVPGFGDRAAWYGMGRIFGVLKGDTLLTMQFTGYPDEAACFEAAKKLAAIAAPKLSG
jgi:hypothetical protein